MRLITIILGALIAPMIYAQKAELRFNNGDILKGNIIQLTQEKLVFEHPVFKTSNNQQTFDLDSISSLSGIQNSEEDNSQKGAIGNLLMVWREDKNVRQDIYKGIIESINDQFVIIDTVYAGKIKVNKKFIQKLSIEDTSRTILSGLGDVKQWIITGKNQDIQVKDNKFILNGSSSTTRNNKITIAREAKAPQLSHTKIVIGRNNLNRPQQFNFGLFATKDVDLRAKVTTLLINSSHGSISIRHHKSNGVISNIRNIGLPREIYNSSKPLTFDIYTNLKTKQVSLYANNIKILSDHKIEDLDSEKIGDHVFFTTYSQKEILVDFTMHSWDGSKPALPEEERIALEPNTKIVKLRNGDTIEGFIKKIENGAAHIKTSYGNFKVRLANITSLDLGITELQQLKMNANTTRLSFYNGSSFIVRILNIKDNKITATSQAYDGEVQFDISLLKSIEFQKEFYDY